MIFYYQSTLSRLMNTAQYWHSPKCSDCKRIRCSKGCNCDCHWDRR